MEKTCLEKSRSQLVKHFFSLYVKRTVQFAFSFIVPIIESINNLSCLLALFKRVFPQKFQFSKNVT